MKLEDKMENIGQTIPAKFVEIQDEAINYAYLLYRLDNLNRIIQKKYKILNRLTTEHIEESNGLPYTYKRIFSTSLQKLVNEKNKVKNDLEKSRPKLVTLMETKNCSEYLVDKEIIVNSSYNRKGDKETIKIPDPKLMEKLKNFFKYAS